jgi:3-hydroxyisobutyryl-CoA hydrolase
VTAVLVAKSSDRPSWSPSSISDESISPANITTNFFDSRSAIQSARPQLILDPPSRSKSGKDQSDSTWGLFRKYGLPSEAAVEAIVSGSAPGSGAFKVTQEELVQRLVDERGDAAGSRAEEVAEWIRAIVKRRCKVGSDGYLDLKRT